MKRLLLFAITCFLAASCSYREDTVRRNVRLDFEITKIKGTNVLVTVTPEKDNVPYIFSVAEADWIDEMLKQGSEAEFTRSMADSSVRYYNNWLEKWPDKGEYTSTLRDHVLYETTISIYALRLKPLTEYYALAVCVDDRTMKPLGPLQKKRFKTIDISPNVRDTEFDFMIYDTKDKFYYYVRPSIKGEICRDAFFSTIIKESDYLAPPYNGDIRKYLEAWKKKMDADIESFLGVDITRFETILDLKENEKYAIVAMLFNSLPDNPIYLRHFKYKKGEQTSYSHDEIIE